MLKVLVNLFCVLSINLLLSVSIVNAQGEASSEVFAYVNGAPIYRSQIEATLKQRSNLDEQSIQSILIKDEVLAQEAKKAGVHLSADYESALDNFSRNYLAKSQIDRILSQAQFSVAIDDPRIMKIISENPSAFFERRLFIFDESSQFQANRSFWNEITNLDNRADILAIGKQYGIDITFESKFVYSSEMAPILLKALTVADDNDIVIFRDENENFGTIFIKLAAYDAALNQTQSVGMARNALVQVISSERIDNEVEKLLDTTVIEYVDRVENSERLGLSPDEFKKFTTVRILIGASICVLTFITFLFWVFSLRSIRGFFYVPFSKYFFKEVRQEVLKFELAKSVEAEENRLRGFPLVCLFIISFVVYSLALAALTISVNTIGFQLLLPMFLTSLVSPFIAFKMFNERLRGWSFKHRSLLSFTFAISSICLSVGIVYVSI